MRSDCRRPPPLPRSTGSGWSRTITWARICRSGRGEAPPFATVFPVDGEYVIDVRLYRQLFDVVIGLGSPHEVEIRVDGERILSAVVGGEETGGAPPAGFVGDIFGSPAWERYGRNADAGLAVRFPARAGSRLVTVSFLGRPTELEDGVPHPPRYPERDESLESNPWVHTVAIRGPYEVLGPGDTPSRRKIFTCRPTRPREEEPCAERILTALAGEAYRRPATGREVGTLLRFFREGRGEGTFDDGVQFALERLLADPKFLFRIEREPVDIAPGTVYPVSDLDLASRLSFFLWSSIPDAELLGAAARGELGAPDGIEQQVRRMLADERAQALVDNFVGQWLLLRNLPSAAPDLNAFPDFDENLREAFERETRLFVESMFREDRSVVDLLRANYTFVNERLARHYGIPNVYGSHFRRVTFGDHEPRGGLLGQGSFLTVTSYPNRTSPVLRGRWVLESLLGTPPPSPPADVPGLPDRGEDGRPASVRERLERHRENLACATCHAPMDPLGFALENFDAVGGWRDAESGSPVDSSAVLPDGTRFRGPGRTPRVPGGPAPSVRRSDDRKAAGVRAGPPARVPRSPDGARHRAGSRGERPSPVRHRSGHRQEPGIPVATRGPGALTDAAGGCGQPLRGMPAAMRIPVEPTRRAVEPKRRARP